LIIGTVLGLTQSRIKRLFAYSTISHVGFILLALCMNTLESTQAYLFYLTQYSIANLNGFLILLSIGWYLYIYTDLKKLAIIDKQNSPIQLLTQLKGLYYLNPTLALSFSITIFSFIGIPPIIGFFAKQMVLSCALESGYIFMSLVGILTSVIGAVYYLNLINIMFFNNNKNLEFKNIYPINVSVASNISIVISILTLIMVFFIFIPQE
jgi:NADH-ubiquinone oxidoreductase chain 2